jgi:hypothetical protein
LAIITLKTFSFNFHRDVAEHPRSAKHVLGKCLAWSDRDTASSCRGHVSTRPPRTCQMKDTTPQ